MKITSELLTIIYERANQYAITKWKEPDYIKLNPDGYLSAVFIDYCCGDTDVTEEYIHSENLIESLDVVAAKRKVEEEGRKIKQEAQYKADQLKRQAQEKENRRIQYLSLQKEFGK